MSNVKIGYAVCAAALCVICGCGKQKGPEIPSAPEAIPVRVEEVIPRSIVRSLEYVGNVKAQEEAQVYPKVSGKILQKVKEDGASVEKGEAIAFIDRDEVGLTFERAPVASPLAGTVGRVYVDRGAQVNPQTPVALVVAIDRVKVVLTIPEQYLSLLSLGQAAGIAVDAFPGEQLDGTVSLISPVVDLATRSAPIEITVQNTEHRLKPGMFARVNLVIAEHQNVPVVMKEALIGKEPELYVYTIEGQHAILKRVTAGLRQGPYVEITEGLKPGEKVVVMGQQRLYENAPVTVGNDSAEARTDPSDRAGYSAEARTDPSDRVGSSGEAAQR